jgi:AcrR family transcriptional regulator
MMLRESLLALLPSKAISQITISELCRLADINRNTFYAHYSSPAALLEEMEEEVIEEVLGVIQNAISMEELVLGICQKVYSMREMNKVVYLKRRDRKFMQRIFAEVKDQQLQRWKSHAPHKSDWEIEKTYAFTQSGTMAIIDAWIREGYPESPETLANFILDTSSLLLGHLKG